MVILVSTVELKEELASVVACRAIFSILVATRCYSVFPALLLTVAVMAGWETFILLSIE